MVKIFDSEWVSARAVCGVWYCADHVEIIQKQFEVVGVVETFPSPGGWHFVRVPKEITDRITKKKSHWGFIPAVCTYKTYTWKSSLLPIGDKTYFIALRAALRKKERITLGDRVCISIIL